MKSKFILKEKRFNQILIRGFLLSLTRSFMSPCVIVSKIVDNHLKAADIRKFTRPWYVKILNRLIAMEGGLVLPLSSQSLKQPYALKACKLLATSKSHG